jgi:hypothetical protein
MKGNALIIALAVGPVLDGCVHRAEQLPVTAGELATNPTTSTLIAYLGQPDADREACGSTGTSLPDDADLPGALTTALVEGKVPPESWGDCVARLLPRLSAPRATQFAEDIVRAAAALLADTRTERDQTVLARRIGTLARVYLERASAGGASDEAARALDDAGHRASGPEALRAAGALAVGLELERGRWQGRPVDAAALDLMASDVGVVLLLRAARRLPDPALRAQAERLVVRQRIAASPFPEVRAAAESVESVVLQQGTNAISLADRPPVRVSLAGSAIPARTVVVRQRPLQDTATLLGRTADRFTPSVLPAIPLTGAIQAQVSGVSRLVTVCAQGRALDPTPCIAPASVVSGSPLAQVRDTGDLRLVEQVSPSVVVELARRRSGVRVPIFVGTAEAGTIVWPVVFERPPDIVLSGRRPGEDGPSLTVTVERNDPGHLVYVVDEGERTISAVVEVGDAGSFRVVSRGGPGRDGAAGMDGMDGLPGTDGMSARCPSFPGSDGSRGRDGASGQDGGDGFPGGRGGDVRVLVIAANPRDDTVALARASIASEGGPGGRGGSGGRAGRGGRGGQGGSGSTCTNSEGHMTFLSGGMSGSPGLDGASGMSGAGGPTGPPGVVRFEASAPAAP